MLEITAAGMRFVARWEDELAPQTVAAFKAILPLDDRIIHCRWSGESNWIPWGDRDLGIGPENATSYPHPGELALYPGGQSETELLFPYGYCSFASKAGHLWANHFATLVEGQEQLKELGRLTLWEGAQPISFRELTSSSQQLVAFSTPLVRVRSLGAERAWMLTIRTTASPRFANVWRRPAGDEHERARAGDHLLALDAEGQLALEDVERVVLGLVGVLGGPPPCGWIVITARLKRGVSALRARNSTLPTRWPSPGLTTTAFMPRAAQRAGERVDGERDVLRRAELGRVVADAAVQAADEEHPGRTPALARMPASWPAPTAARGPARRGAPAPRGARRGSPPTSPPAPSESAPRCRALRRAGRAARCRERGRPPRPTTAGDHVRAARLDREPPDRRDGAVDPARDVARRSTNSAAATSASSRPSIGVVPACPALPVTSGWPRT